MTTKARTGIDQQDDRGDHCHHPIDQSGDKALAIVSGGRRAVWGQRGECDPVAATVAQAG
jgi:hypothetical protein